MCVVQSYTVSARFHSTKQRSYHNDEETIDESKFFRPTPLALDRLCRRGAGDCRMRLFTHAGTTARTSASFRTAAASPSAAASPTGRRRATCLGVSSCHRPGFQA